MGSREEVPYTEQDQDGLGWILHSATKLQRLLDHNAKQHCEALEDQPPESFTWLQPPPKEDISKRRPIASPEGTYPNHFNTLLSNLFSKLPPCRFSQQPGPHFATSLKVQTFNPTTQLKSSPDVIWHLSVVMEEKLIVTPFKATFSVSGNLRFLLYF